MNMAAIARLALFLAACVSCSTACTIPCIQGKCTPLNYPPFSLCTCTIGFAPPYCDRRVPACNYWKPCGSHGTCHDKPYSAPFYTCSCSSGYHGSQCQDDPCHSQPCGQHGRCSVQSHSPYYSCSCTSGYTGSQCQDDPCHSQPCGQHGRCSVQSNSPYYSCSCTSGYTGSQCQVDPCQSHPCGNHGQCVQQSNTPYYACKCQAGYSGNHCQDDACHNVNCGHGACKLDGNAPFYQCTCYNGFSGGHCEYDGCHTETCSGHGTCSLYAHAPWYQCTCNNGYSGAHCEIDACHGQSCNNHGPCSLSTRAPWYHCTCHNGFTGGDCQYDPCHGNSCSNHGTCSASLLTPYHKCTCANGYSGENCQYDACHRQSCSGHGTCDLLASYPFFRCTCNSGFTGSICQNANTWSSWSHMTSCSVTCGSGFISRERTCGGSGSGCVGKHTDIVQCEMRPCIQCGPLPQPLHGRVHIDGRSVGGMAVFTCLSGYIVSGASHRYCLANGQWSETQPTCVPAPGVWSDWSRWSSSSQTCGRQTITRIRVCHKPSSHSSCSGPDSMQIVNQLTPCSAGCPSLGNPQHGHVTQSNHTTGSMAVYACTNGYHLSGQADRYCQDTNTWSGSEPTCVMKCQQLANPRHGAVQPHSTDVGSKATFTCISGYALHGSTPRVCQADGTWSGSDVTCVIV